MRTENDASSGPVPINRFIKRGYLQYEVSLPHLLEYDDSARDRLQLMFLVYALRTIYCIHVMHINGR